MVVRTTRTAFGFAPVFNFRITQRPSSRDQQNRNFAVTEQAKVSTAIVIEPIGPGGGIGRGVDVGPASGSVDVVPE